MTIHVADGQEYRLYPRLCQSWQDYASSNERNNPMTNNHESKAVMQ